MSDALAGTACREARSPSLEVRTVVGEVTIELRYIIHAPDELAAAKAADRVSALLAERAFSRVDGDISFGRPLQLG